MKLVIDASMALAWLFERSKNDEAQCANRVLLAIANAEARIPSLWHTEIANSLLVGERRKVVTEAQVIDYLDRLSHLPLVTDDVTPASRRDNVMALAREYGLTAYGATYLELALRTNSILATFDSQLINAMHHAGGEIFADKQ